MKAFTKLRVLTAALAASSLMAAAPSASAANFKVGFVTSLVGPVSSLGIPYQKGILAGQTYQSEIDGKPVELIQLDDASDPSTAARNARKLIEEDKVDAIIGTAGSPGAMAIAAVAREAKVPLISIAHANLKGADAEWVVTVPQPATLMISAVVEHMKAEGVKTLGYIGFSDAWGDEVYSALEKTTPEAGIKVVSNERYARSDASVAGQMLKIVAQKPDAVITGNSGTPGALPYLALAERGYKGKLYGTHALINPAFVNVARSSVEGLLAPTGPVIVAEQLPDSNPIKAVSMAYRDAYKKANDAEAADAFSAYSFDAWLIYLDSAKRAAATAEPGTPEYRQAMRDALKATHELVGTHGVYNFKEDTTYGTDERARVVVRLEKGHWQLVP